MLRETLKPHTCVPVSGQRWGLSADAVVCGREYKQRVNRVQPTRAAKQIASMAHHAISSNDNSIQTGMKSQHKWPGREYDNQIHGLTPRIVKKITKQKINTHILLALSVAVNSSRPLISEPEDAGFSERAAGTM